MSDSSRLGLPYLAAGQAQKHITVNESLLRLDALVQLSAVSASISAQPGAPADGGIYVLPTGKTGAAWSAMANGALAYYRDGSWEEITPREGFRVWINDADQWLIYDGAAWQHAWGAGERKLLFTPGGDGVVSIYRIDAARAQNPRTATISSIASDVITLTTADAGLFFTNSYMAGVSYLRIWNTSKTPNQSAWVKAQPANNQLQVLSAAALVGWANGETIQIGDPTSVTPNRVIALDISPMMQNVLGRVFRQAGVQLKSLVEGLSVQAVLDTSEAGVSGSFGGFRSESGGSRMGGHYPQACSVLSPISNSNLVFLRETVAGTALGVTAISIVGLWV